jgi:hypothetical protein
LINLCIDNKAGFQNRKKTAFWNEQRVIFRNLHHIDCDVRHHLGAMEVEAKAKLEEADPKHSGRAVEMSELDQRAAMWLQHVMEIEGAVEARKSGKEADDAVAEEQKKMRDDMCSTISARAQNKREREHEREDEIIQQMQENSMTVMAEWRNTVEKTTASVVQAFTASAGVGPRATAVDDVLRQDFEAFAQEQRELQRARDEEQRKRDEEQKAREERQDESSEDMKKKIDSIYAAILNLRGPQAGAAGQD